MTVRHRSSFCLSGLVIGLSIIVEGVAWAGPNSISVSPSVSGGAFARPDITNRSLNVGRTIAPLGAREPAVDTSQKKKNTAKKNESLEGKTLRTKQRLQTKTQDTVLRSGRKGRPATEGSPQPDPPKIVQPAVTLSPAASVGVAGPSIAPPPGLDQRFQDKVDAQVIDEIKALEAAVVGLPQRQAGRPGNAKSPFGDAVLPGNVPEPNATVPGATERLSAEDILAGRAFGSQRDDKRDIARGYPGAAGGAVPNRGGQASEDGVITVATEESRADGTRIKVVETYSEGVHSDKQLTVREVTLTRADGSWVTRREEWDSGGELWRVTYHNSRSGLIYAGFGPRGVDQPAPTDDYRTGGKDNCNWVPLVGCTARVVSPQDMTGQPGRGERSEVPVAGLPDSDQVTNPAEGREGPVGLRAPVNPGGNQPVDPEPGPDGPSPR